jgi:glycosyltransferase involved in cell wall biosynthesis
MEYKISIFLPNYNEQKHAVRCISSILQQNYKNYEAFFIDDCSTDCSVASVKSIVSSDTRFKLIEKNENKGVFDSFEIFLTNFSGDLLCSLGSDDMFLDKNYLLDAVDGIKAHPEAGGFFGRTALLSEETGQISGIMGNAPQLGFINKMNARKAFFSNNLFIPGHSLIIKSLMVKKYGINYRELGPQQDFFANHLYSMKHGIIFSDKAYTCMNLKKGNTNFSSNGNLWEMTARLEIVERKFREWIPFTDEIEKLLPSWRARWTIDAIRKTGANI